MPAGWTSVLLLAVTMVFLMVRRLLLGFHHGIFMEFNGDVIGIVWRLIGLKMGIWWGLMGFHGALL